MVFEPNFMKVVSSARKSIGITQSVIELKLPTNEDVINSVYSVTANSTILNSEVMGRELQFSGIVDFQAIYDSAGISAIDYTAEFKDKFDLPEEVMGEVILNSNVVDVTSSIVSNGIRVVAIIEVTIDEIYSRDINLLTDANGDGVYSTSRQIDFSTYIGKGSEHFDVSGDFEVRDVNKLLMVSPRVCLGRVEARDNYVVVSGIVEVDACLQGGEDPSDIMTHSHTFDFTTEVALDGIDENSIIHNQLSILYNEIKVSSTEEEGGLLVSVYIPLLYNGYVFKRNSIQVVDDVYSSQNYLAVTSENFDTLVGKNPIKFKDNISGSASILETSPFIDTILGVCTNNIVLASSNVMGDKLFVEGVANATVVYFTKESSSITSVQVEMPFSVEERVEGMEGDVVTICLNNVTARSKRGKEIEVSAELSVYADMSSINTETVISNVVVGDEKPNDDCTLYIYVARPEQTVWDIAKEMNVSEEMILEQNEGLKLPLNGGEKIVIYRPKVFGFEN